MNEETTTVLAPENIQPLHDRVLLEPVPEPTKRGSIHIPEAYAQHNNSYVRHARVRAIGKRVKGVEVGQIVLVNPGFTENMSNSLESMFMTKEECILAIVEGYEESV